MSKDVFILIADDLGSARHTEAKFLMQDGYKVAEAFGIVECLKKVESLKPDIVLLGQSLYDADIPICEKIKKINNLKYTFVVLLENDKIAKRRSIEYNLKSCVDEYIASTVHRSELFLRIEAISHTVVFEKSVAQKEKIKLRIHKAVRFYSVVSQINQAIVREHNRDKLIQKICDVAVEHGKLKMAWFGLVGKDKKSVIPVACSGDENGYLSVISKITMDESNLGKGPTGSALRAGEYVICSDIADDTDMKPWRDEALKRGYRSSVALPIKIFDNVIGSYNLYSDEPYFFDDDDEIKLLREVAVDISYAFQNIEIEKEKAEMEAKMSAVLDAMPDLLIVLNREGRYLDIFTNIVDSLIEPPDKLIDRTIYNVLPEKNTDSIRKMIAEVISTGKTGYYEYSLEIRNRIKWFSASVAKFKFQGSYCVLWAARDDTERRKTEQAVQKNEEQLKMTLNSIGDAVITTDIEGKIVRMNRIAEMLTGWSFAEAKGKPLNTVFHIVNEKNKKPVANPVNRALTEGVIVGLANHTLLISKDKREFNISDSAAPIIDTNGNVFGVVLVFSNVTKQKKIEQALKESEERYRTAFKTIPDAVALSLISGKYVDINGGFTRLTGFTGEDVIGRRSSEIDIWAIPEDREKLVRELGEKGAVCNLESQFRCKDGSLKTALMSANIVKLKGESHILSITHDITEQEKMEQALKESEKRFRTLVEQITDAIFLSDMDGNIIDVNRASCESLGYSYSELLRLNIRDLDPIYEKDDHKNRLWKSLTFGNPVIIETIHKRKDGSIFPVEINIGIVKLAGKSVVLGSARDITERKLHQEAIRRKNKQLLLLSDASTKINKVLDLSIILEQLTIIAIELTDSKSGAAALYENNQMVFKKYFDNGKIIDADDRFNKGYGITGWVAETKKPYITNDAESDKHVIKQIRARLGFHRLIDVPILGKEGDLLGCFEIYNTKDKRPYDKNDIEMLQGLSANAAVAIENAQMLLEREKIKEELSSERDKFSFILDSLPIGVVVLDKDDKYIFINPSALKIDVFHAGIADLIDKDIRYSHPEEVDHRIDELIEDFKSGKKTFYERESRRGKKTVKISHHALYDKAKKYIGLIRTSIDITEQKKAEMKIMESRQRLSSLLSNTPLGAIFWDLDFKVTDWNRSAEKIFGYSKKEVLGRHLVELIVPAEIQNKINAISNQLFNQTGGNRSANANITKEGKRILCEWYNVAITDINGKIVGIASLVDDITERKNIEEKLIQGEQILKEAQKIAHIGHWEYHIESGKLLWSDELYRISGVPRDKFIGTHAGFLKLLHPEDRKKADKVFHDSLKDDKEHSSNLRLVKYGTKEIRYLEIKYKRFKDEKGKVAGVMGTDQDITEKTRLQQSIKEKEDVMLAQSRQAAMGEMISMIAHQWRQPLAVISMGVNNVLADIELDTISIKELKRIAKLILNQTQHLSKTIDDFRNFFRPIKSSDKILPEDIINEALKFTGKSLEYHSIDVRENHRVTNPVKTYSRELLQVVIAIIQNAKDALVQSERKHRYIQIDTYENADKVYIKIYDNAGGIDKDIISRIFEPYFSTKEKQTGTGLGLYIAKIIVEKHLDGRIWAENINNGACFFVEIGRNLADE